MSIGAHIIYGVLWLSFGVVHSLLASHSVKARLGALFGRGYRFAYNLLALIHIGLVIYGGQYALASDAHIFEFSQNTIWALVSMMVIGLVTVAIALSEYDLGQFSGIAQLFKASGAENDEPLQTGGLHRFVRHPLYTGVYLYLWGSVRTEFDLVTAVWASLYLVIGTHFEERKLISDYGDAYRDYKSRVPSVIPWRGRAI